MISIPSVTKVPKHSRQVDECCEALLMEAGLNVIVRVLRANCSIGPVRGKDGKHVLTSREYV
jgi:hypothetical protein